MNSEINEAVLKGQIKTNFKDYGFIVFCAVYVYLHLFVLPNTPIFHEEDHLIFAHDGWRMFLGESLYKDFFQLTFPGMQVVYFFLFHIFGTKFWIINALVFVQAISQTVICFLIAKHFFAHRWFVYLAPSLYLFFGFRWFGIDGSHRMFSPIFLWLAIYVLLKSRSLSRLATAGFLCALASFFTQQRGILAVGAIGVFLVWEAFQTSSKWKKLFIDEAVLGGTFLLIITLLIAPFLISAGAETFFYDTFLYLRSYVQDTNANFYQSYWVSATRILNMGLLVSSAMFFYYALIPLVYIIVGVYVWKKRNDSKIADKNEILLVALVGLFLSLGTFAPNPGRFFQICVPALILLVWLIHQIKFQTLIFARLVVVGLMIFGAFLAFRIQSNWETRVLEMRTGKAVFFSDVVMERYQWLLENTEENEYVFEVYYCTVYFPVLIRNPTPVTYLWNNGFSPPWQVESSIESLKAKQPRYILWDAAWNEELKIIEEGENLQPLYEYLQQNYSPKKRFTPYGLRHMEVWERKKQTF